MQWSVCQCPYMCLYVVLVCVFVCTSRQQHHTGMRPETTLYIPAAAHDPGEEMALQPSYYDSRKARGPGVSRVPPKPPQAHGGRENIYAPRSKMEQRPLPSIPNLSEESQMDDSDGSDKIQVFRTNSGKEHCHYHPRVVMRTGAPRSATCVAVAGPQVPSSGAQQVPATPTGSASGSGSGVHGAVGGGPAVVAGAGPQAAGPAPSKCTGTGSGTPTPASCKDDPQYFVLDPDQDNDPSAHARRAARHAQQPDSGHGHGQGQSQASRGPHKSPEEENAENINKEVHINNSCHEIPLRPTREGSQTRTDNSNSTSNSSWP